MEFMNHRPFSVFSFLIILCIASSCSPLQKVEEVDDFGYKSVFFVSKKNQVKEGAFERFDSEGKLYETGTYLKGKLEGEKKVFYPNGSIEVLETYKNGSFDGVSKSYFEDGNLKTEGQYIDNIASGIWKSFYANGKQREEVLYENNEENGPFKEWHENGMLKAEGTYKGGDNEHGELKLYDEKGELERKMDCQMGLCKTIWKKDSGT
ncbi:MAG: toxin-antitoxin system YwqK family antitoxin [Saprospiraceae bacterium]|nr:toxin-antitoxin system YwqK family antitoxin [Saprospiraceae bacterium]